MPADPAVKAIQEKLAEIGFTFVGKPDGVLGARTRMAVREFQHYASKEYVAKLKNGAPPSRYIDGLERVKNNHRFPVNYKPNGRHDLPAPDQTLTLLDAWWQAKYRCPVVVEARRRVAAGEVIPAFGNLWLYDDPVVTDFLIRNKVRSKISGALLEFRAADFSVAAPQTEWLSMPIVGSMYIYGRYRGGVTFNTAHLEDDLEYLPENLTGQNWGQLGNEGKVLFRIVRTMAEQECRGFFDCLNGYDNAVMSLGPCHWTLALGCGTPPRKKNTKMLSGELAPFLAYVIGRHPDVLKDHFAPYGVSVKGDWPSGSSGAAFKGSWEATRNFLGRLQWWTGGPRDEEIAQFQDLQWFRTTHWFHRFVVMSRTSPELRLRQWDMVRMRLRDILICKLGGNGPYRDNRIGDLYTSDLSLALLLRCHVRLSSFTNPKVRASVRSALDLSEMSGKPEDWGDAEEARLIDGLMACAIRETYKGKKIAPAKGSKESMREALLKFGAGIPRGNRKGLHLGTEMIRAWPDPKLFREIGYRLQAEARIALAGTRDKKKTIMEFLRTDASLPPPPL